MPGLVQATGPLPPVPGFERGDFEKLAESGFGDPMNNYAWSMGYFKGDLYVGTGRNSCWGVIRGMGLPSEIEDLIFEEITVPSGDPGLLEQANDMRAEIWRYHDGEWGRVYQASVFELPAHPGVYVATEMGFRGKMVTFTDKYEEEAIYAARAGALPPMNVILKSTDGTTWERVVTPLLTFGSSRAMAVHNGKLYVGGGEAGPRGGGPLIWATDDPSTTSDNWTQVADFTAVGPGTNTAVGSLASFNGYLYAGVDNRENGFQVFRSNAQLPVEPTLGEWTQIVNFGAGDMHNWRAACMEVLNNRLYVGSLSLPGGPPGGHPGFQLPKGCEVIRINPDDDSWELVIGDYFPLVPPPGGPLSRLPISGWPGGFGNPLNLYCWSLEEEDNVLYLGTFDVSSFLQFVPPEDIAEFLAGFIELTPEQQEQIVEALEQVIEQLEDLGVDEYYIEPFRRLLAAFQSEPTEPIDWEEVWQVFIDYFAGADLWKTEDGIHWWPVTLNGFDNPDNYGFRNMVSGSLYVGTANPFQGCEIWKAQTPTGESTDPDGVSKDAYAATENVYVTGSGFRRNSEVDMYVVEDLAWNDGDPIPADVSSDGMNTLTTDDYGNLAPTNIWPPPLIPGGYDIVFDANQNGVYDASADCVDHPDHPGFVVLPPPSVGGEAYPVNKLAVLAPWVAIGTAIIAASFIVMRRRRAERQA